MHTTMRALAVIFIYLAAAARAPVAEKKAGGRRLSGDQVAKLTASDAAADDLRLVRGDADTIVVGAWKTAAPARSMTLAPDRPGSRYLTTGGATRR